MTLIKHTDDFGKDWNIPFFDIENIDELHVHYRGEVYDAIKNSIIEMLCLGLDRIPSFSASNMVFELNKDDVDNQLDSCISYYSEIEEYETCSTLLNLKNTQS